jgi:hypothetical protein
VPIGIRERAYVAPSLMFGRRGEVGTVGNGRLDERVGVVTR